MKFLQFVLCVLLVLSIASSKASAQKIEEGEFRFGVIESRIIDESLIDSSTLQMYTRAIKENFPAKILFKDGFLVLLEKESLGEAISARNVIDVRQSIHYRFLEKLDAYVIDTLDQAGMMNIQRKAEQIEILEVRPMDEKIWGLNTYQVRCRDVDSQSEMEYICTEDLLLPETSFLNMFTVRPDQLILQGAVEVPGAILTIGVTEFIPTISDPELFSTSLAGYSDGQPMVDEFLNMSENWDEEEEEAPFQGQRTNLDLLGRLIQDQQLDTTSYLVRYEYEDLLENNASMDTPTLLHTIKSDGRGDITESIQALMDVLSKYEVLPGDWLFGIEAILRSHPEWGADISWNVLRVAHLQSYLNQEAVRRNIVDNHFAMQLGDPEREETVRQYLSGEIDLTGFILGITDLVQPLRYGTIYDRSELPAVAQSFFNLAVGDLVDEIKITEQRDTLLISTEKYQYLLPLDRLLPYDYTDEGNAFIFADSVQLTAEFYNVLLEKAKQIDADYQSPYAFSIYEFKDMFRLLIDPDDYDRVVRLFPELDCFKVGFGLNRFLVEEYDVFNNIPVSFPFHPSSTDQQLEIRGYKIGDVDGNTHYVTTDEKRRFIAYLSDHRAFYGVSDTGFRDIAARIEIDLIPENFNLLSYVPDFGITYDKLSDPYVMRPDYVPNINSERNNFADVFPVFDRLVNGAFKATDFSYDKEAETISFKYRKQSYTIPAGNEPMLEKMASLLKETGEKRIYYIYEGLGETKYFYLTPAEKKELEVILNTRFKEPNY